MLNSLSFIFLVIYLNFPQKNILWFLLSDFSFCCFYYYVHVCVWRGHTHTTVHVWGSEDNSEKSAFPFYLSMGSWDLTQIKHFSPWSVRALWLPGSHCSGRGLVRILHCYSLYNTLRMWLLRLKVCMATSGRFSGPQKNLLGVSHQLRDPLQIFRKIILCFLLNISKTTKQLCMRPFSFKAPCGGL